MHQLLVRSVFTPDMTETSVRISSLAVYHGGDCANNILTTALITETYFENGTMSSC